MNLERYEVLHAYQNCRNVHSGPRSSVSCYFHTRGINCTLVPRINYLSFPRDMAVSWRIYNLAEKASIVKSLVSTSLQTCPSTTHLIFARRLCYCPVNPKIPAVGVQHAIRIFQAAGYPCILPHYGACYASWWQVRGFEKQDRVLTLLQKGQPDL